MNKLNMMAATFPLSLQDIDIKVPTQFLSNDLLPNLFTFEKDVQVASVTTSTLDKPVLLQYYLAEWEKWKWFVVVLGY